MRWLVAVFLVLIIGIGGAAFYALRLARERDVEIIAITSAWPGASPVDVERAVSEPIERAVMKTRGLVEVHSESREGVSLVTVVVKREGRDGFLIAHEVREGLNATLPELPTQVMSPTVSRMLPPQRAQHHRFVVRSSELSQVDLSRWVEWELRRKLEMQSGVRSAELCGIVEDVVVIHPDLQRLSAYGLKPLELIDAVERANLELPGGGTQFLIGGSLKSIDDLGNVMLKAEVRLRDVATIERTGAPQPCVAWENGTRVVSVDVISEGPLEKPLELPVVPPSISVKEATPIRSETWAVEDERALSKLSVAGLVLKRDVVELLVDPSATPADFEKLRQTPGLAPLWMDGDTLVRISGDDLDALEKQGEVVRKKLIDSFPAHTVGARPRNSRPELQIIPRERNSEVAQLISFALGGRTVATMYEGERRIDVSVKLDLREPEQLMDRLRELRLADGRPLSSIVEVQMRDAPASVTRVNARRVVALHTSAPASDVRKVLSEVQLPIGMAITVP